MQAVLRTVSLWSQRFGLLSVGMEFRILGPIEVTGAGNTVSLAGRREGALLAALVLGAGEVVSADRLIDALWRDRPPRSAAKTLQNCVLRLRKTLGANVIETRPGGYRLVAPGDAIDAHRFEELIRVARTAAMNGTPARAAAALDEALGLWRGQPYSELAGWDPADGEAARLTELHRVATEDFIDAELACGRHVAHVADIEAMVAAEPLRERRWAMLMLALYRCGQQADALRTYQRARIALAELGIEPGPELRDMERAVIAQDESLAVPPAVAEAASVRSEVGSTRVSDDRERDGVVHRHGGFDGVGVEPGARRRGRAASRALRDLASGGRRGGRHRGEEPG